jgi:GNAT superfamily N-acetyltransferase
VTALTIRECPPNDAAMQRFLDREWPLVEPPPWITTRVALVAERDGTIIGAATGRVHAGVAHLNELMVTAAARSGGIGAQLLAAFEAWAQGKGAHLYELETRADGPAQRFYARHGWRMIVTRDDYYNHATWVLMAKTP